jgi:hypothetical protein
MARLGAGLSEAEDAVELELARAADGVGDGSHALVGEGGGVGTGADLEEVGRVAEVASGEVAAWGVEAGSVGDVEDLDLFLA